MIKSIARLYGGLRRTADEFRNQIMETEELREIRGEYHRTRNEINSARDLAQRELNRAMDHEIGGWRYQLTSRADKAHSAIWTLVEKGLPSGSEMISPQAETPEGMAPPPTATTVV